MTENTNYEFKDDISVLNEINLLRCKLDTKSQVLKSISKELIICRKEKDEFKLMAEQLGEKCSLMKKRIEKLSSMKNEDEINLGSLEDYNQLVLNQNYKKLQDSHKLLNFELNDLRIKLTDAESDCRMLREKLTKLNKKRSNYSDNIIDNISEDRKTNQHLIEMIEKLKMKNKELEKDLKLHLDDKEDLIKSRNLYIQKAERLNESLSALMTGVENEPDNDRNKRPIQFLDIDSILSENKFLKEKLKFLEEDKKLGQEMITKYKQALDKTSSKKNFFEISNLTKSSKRDDKLNYFNKDLNQDSIVSTRELQSFIASNNLDHLELNESTLLKLRKLVIILFESISDKSAALNLAKINNKLLGKRINDLENNLKFYESKEKNLRIKKMRLNDAKNGSSESSSSGLVEETECDEICELVLTKNKSTDQESELEDCLSVKSINDSSENPIRTDDHLDRDDDLIDLPNNLQRLVTKELDKLKHNE